MNFKPKRTAATLRGFLATAWFSCVIVFYYSFVEVKNFRSTNVCCFFFKYGEIFLRFSGYDFSAVFEHAHAKYSSGGSTLGPGGTGPPNLARPPPQIFGHSSSATG